MTEAVLEYTMPLTLCKVKDVSFLNHRKTGSSESLKVNFLIPLKHS